MFIAQMEDRILCTYEVSQKQKHINVTSQFNHLNTPWSYKTNTNPPLLVSADGHA